MYGLTNFLSVLWYTVMGWFGLHRLVPHAVTLFNGADEPPIPFADNAFEMYDENDVKYGGMSLDADLRVTNPNGWGLNTID
jgi:hypothetical protein